MDKYRKKKFHDPPQRIHLVRFCLLLEGNRGVQKHDYTGGNGSGGDVLFRFAHTASREMDGRFASTIRHQ
jgi:hypothetical protein